VCRESRPPLRSSADIRYMVSDACAVRVVLRVCRWTQAASGAARRANDGRCLASSSPQMTPRTLYIVCIHVVGCRSLFLLPLVLQCNILVGWPGPHYSPNRLDTHGVSRSTLTAVGRSQLLARWPGTLSRILSVIPRAAQTV